MPYDGKLPLTTERDSSWRSVFGKLLAVVYKLDSEERWNATDGMQLTLKRGMVYQLIATGWIHGDLLGEKLARTSGQRICG